MSSKATDTRAFIQKSVNEHCWVKLTPYGMHMHYKEHENFIDKFPSLEETSVAKYCPPYEEDGWHCFQFWTLMKIFGEHMTVGGKQLFEGNEIRFEKKETDYV